MLVGIMADSHDHIDGIKSALAVFREKGVAAVVHAGDVVAPFAAKVLKDVGVPLYAVFGNNDGERVGLARVIDIVEPPRTVELGGRKIVVAHEPGEIPDALARGADVIVTGHTHEASIGTGTPMLINPGETGGWLTSRKTCVVLDLETLQGHLCDLVVS